MKTIKKIVFVLACIIALLLIIALFTKKEYAIERAITINKSKQEVFNYIKHLKNQDYYSAWVMMDPNMKKEFKGTDGTAGFVYAWDGNKKAGKGEQEIKGITEGERIEMEVRFIKPFEGKADTYMTTASIAGRDGHADQTNVKWAFASKMKYPMNLLLLFMNMDKILGKDMETSLTRLKNTLEK
jgi:hypothetical protein